MRILKRARTAALGLSLCLLAAALPADASGKPDYVIRENFFVGMITDIFMNMSDYRGKTIQYEGFVLPITAENFGEGPEKFAVVRIAVCCGPDDMPRYRNKMEYTFGDLVKDGEMTLRMHRKGSFMSIVTVDECQLVHEDFNKVLKSTLARDGSRRRCSRGPQCRSRRRFRFLVGR